jgi:protein TonB
MFSKLDTKSRRRRILSPTMVAVSVGAHVILLAGAMYASHGDPRPLERVEPNITWIEPTPIPVQPEPKQPVVLRPAELPRVPVPRGETVVMPDPPEEIPSQLPALDPAEQPVRPSQVDGIGGTGSPDGDPNVRPVPGAPVIPGGGGGDEPYQPSAVEERPALRNAAEMQRVLQRLYPELLRDAGMAGQTQLQFVVDTEGRVEPGSVTVVSATHPAFEAASLRAAEMFRFRPAKIGGRAVRVVINMPITWQLDGN